MDPQEERLKAGVQPDTTYWSKENAEQYGQLYFETTSQIVVTECGGYQDFYLQLADAINSGAQLPVTAEEALWNIRLIELAMESSRLGQTIKVEL